MLFKYNSHNFFSFSFRICYTFTFLLFVIMLCGKPRLGEQLSSDLRNELRRTCSLVGYQQLLRREPCNFMQQCDYMFKTFHGSEPGNIVGQIELLMNANAPFTEMFDTDQATLVYKGDEYNESIQKLSLKNDLSRCQSKITVGKYKLLI